jgi:hypothetical protein
MEVSPLTPWIIVWVLLPFISVPLMVLVAYRLYGLWTGVYRMDRDGFSMRWGQAVEQIPLDQVHSVQPVAQLDHPVQPSLGLWWPGCVAVQVDDGQAPALEVFAGSGLAEGILIVSEGRRLAIAPAAPQLFVKSFTDATRLGSLHPLRARSERPDYVLADVWKDRLARALILAGAILPLALLAYLGWGASGIAGTVPFGFDALGNPGPPAPPGRLLLLPFMAGAMWLIDLSLGAWLFRAETTRRLAYALWAVAVAGGLLLWGAAVHLISRA